MFPAVPTAQPSTFFPKMPVVSCTKKFSGYPFAHRQPEHDGHCALIHGHNWDFEFEFAPADGITTDSCDFVVDFGKMKWIKEWLDANFDHTLVLNTTDPFIDYLTCALAPTETRPAFAAIVDVPSCSCEGLAKYVWGVITVKLAVQVPGVVLRRVTVWEDLKNSATYLA